MKTPKFQPMVRAAAALAIALAGTVPAFALTAVPAMAEANAPAARRPGAGCVGDGDAGFDGGPDAGAGLDGGSSAGCVCDPDGGPGAVAG